MAVEQKIWGTTEKVIDSPLMTAHSITVVKGGQCSWHHHERKWNAFVVVSGILLVDTEHSVKKLYAGDVVAVPPGVNHQFIAVSDVVAMEWYWPDILGEDIVRLTTGKVG
jgi:mannose-6-phosphate isomerase-like protein (cupin superfamily)